MAKVSNFIVGILLISVLVYSSASLFSEGATKYGVTYDNTTFDGLQRLNEINIQVSNATNEKTNDLNTEPGETQPLDNLFARAYSTVKSIGLSFDTFFSMVGVAAGPLMLNDVHIATIVGIVFVLIFIGVILSALVKWYL